MYSTAPHLEQSAIACWQWCPQSYQVL